MTTKAPAALLDVTLPVTDSGTGSALSLTLPVASDFANNRITLFGTYGAGSQTVWFNATYLVV